MLGILDPYRYSTSPIHKITSLQLFYGRIYNELSQSPQVSSLKAGKLNQGHYPQFMDAGQGPSAFEVFPLYYASKALIMVLGIGMILYAYWKPKK